MKKRDLQPHQSTSTPPADGPIAVTGASGYIGSWIVQDCMEQGYEVRACVRDKNNPAKVEHLLDLNYDGMRGSVSLYEADLFKPGSYDEAFKGCAAVIHAGATVGFNKETPQEVYDGCFKENAHVIESVKRSGSVKRFVFTSSFAAVSHLPHLLAFAMMHSLTAQAEGEQYLALAGSGFRDFTRIAGSSPEMWRDISLANRSALLTEIDEYLARLQAVRAMIDASDGAALDAVFANARNARQAWLESIEKQGE